MFARGRAQSPILGRWRLIFCRLTKHFTPRSYSVTVAISAIYMANEQRIYEGMDFEDSESESFLPKPTPSAISKRRNLYNKFALLGWVIATILFGINFYSWVYLRKPTDIECTRQLNAWCKSSWDEWKLRQKCDQSLIWTLEAPVFDVVEYENVQFSNTFYQPSPYRGKPTPELEKSWSDLWKSKDAIKVQRIWNWHKG